MPVPVLNPWPSEQLFEDYQDNVLIHLQQLKNDLVFLYYFKILKDCRFGLLRKSLPLGVSKHNNRMQISSFKYVLFAGFTPPFIWTKLVAQVPKIPKPSELKLLYLNCPHNYQYFYLFSIHWTWKKPIVLKLLIQDFFEWKGLET